MSENRDIVPAKPIDRFKMELVAREAMLKSLLPSTMGVDKFQAIVASAVADNMDLLECDRGSLLKACLQAAELGLALNKSMAEADILKVWNGKTKRYEAQFRPRYKGLMKLALQSGDVKKIESRIVYANDDFSYEEGTNPRITHKVKMGNRGDMIGAYCTWTLSNGETQFEVMDRDQILAIRDRSSSKTKEGKVVGPWVTDEGEMWRKTVVRRATKYMPMSPEVARAVRADNVAEGIEDIDEGIDSNEYSGEAFDITDFTDDTPQPTPEPEVAATRVSSLEEKIAAKPKAAKASAPEVETLHPNEDDDGLPNWAEWAMEAISLVSDMDDATRNAWKFHHEEMINEAELMEPRAVSALLKLLK